MNFSEGHHHFMKLVKKQAENFKELLEQHAALSFEKQILFGELVGSNPWQFDMRNGEISFGPSLVFKVQIMGSIAFSEGSWMWGWANSKSGIPPSLLNQSYLLQSYGENHEISKLTEPDYLVEGRFDHQIGMIACGILGAGAYYSANYGKGSLVVTITDPRLSSDGSKDLHRIPGFFTQLVSQVEIDHREAFKNYLIDKQLLVDENATHIFGMKDNFMIKAEFDSLNRLTDLTTQS